MAKLTDLELIELIRQHLDLDRLLAQHPEVTRADIEALWRRLAPDPPPARRAAGSPGLFDEVKAPRASVPSGPPPRRQRAGEHLVVVARCDGAARGNPGPAAIGVVIEDTEGQALLDAGERIGSATNNVAEYRAVIRAAEKALELGATELLLRLDSELLVFQLEGRYRVRAPHLRPLHQQALRLLEQFRRWEVAHVPREQNAAADALANRALDGF